MNKQARRNKAEFEHERAVEREKARFDSLTPEEQEKELAERKQKRLEREKQRKSEHLVLRNWNRIVEDVLNRCGNSYNKFI